MIIDKIKIGNTTYNVGARYQDVSGTPTKTSDFTNDGDGTSNYATEDYVDLNGGKIDKIKVNNVEQTITNKEVNINVPTATSDLTNDSGFIDKSVNNLDNYTPSSQTTTRLELVLDSSTFKLKGILKDSSNNVIYTSNEIDLPLETVVVDGTYDSLTKEIVLELVNGNTIRFSVSALVSGLISDTDLATALENYYTKGQVDNLLNAKQNTITSSNKLDSDLVDDTNSTNKFVTSAEKNAWNGKQDELTAGENITIVNNVISASGGGSSDGVTLHYLDDSIGKAPNYLILDDLEVGLYAFKNYTSKYIDIKGTAEQNAVRKKLNYYDYPFEIIKKYSEANIGEVFLIMGTKYGNFTGERYTPVITYTKSATGFYETASSLDIFGNVSYLTSAQTISAKKTFTVLPESSVTPTTNNQLTNKEYVDSAIASAITDALEGGY